MERRTFAVALIGITTLAFVGCKDAAKEQAALAKVDLANAENVVKTRHVDAFSRAMPVAASSLGAATDRPGAFGKLRDKTDDLRSAKRSYFALTDADGAITYVDDNEWKIVDRKLKGGFPSVAAVLAGEKPYAEDAGRYGDDGPKDLTFMSAAAIKGADGKIIGALVAGWDVHEAAQDLQRQLASDLRMKIAEPKRRVKEQDRLQLAIDTPEIWVAFYQGDQVFMPYNTPQPLEDAVRGAGLSKLDPNGATGTVKVMNSTWGFASKLINAPVAGVGLAIFRYQTS